MASHQFTSHFISLQFDQSMASLAHQTMFVFFTLLISTTVSNAQNPKALVLPITKDSSTLQYLTHLSIGSPHAQKTLVVDLGGTALWMDCSNGYRSSTYKPGNCGAAACSFAKAICVSLCLSPPSPGCHNNTCRVYTRNAVSTISGLSEIAIDTISLRSTNGSKTSSSVSIPNFIFGCNINYYLNLEDLASGANGMIGLSKDRIALPSQLSSAFGGSFRRKFAICLPSTSKSNGILFFGESPYVFYPGYNTSKAIDVSSRFSYTKLHVNYQTTASPRVQGAQLPGYFVKITSILVNRRTVPVNSTLLDFHRTGFGGSTISTVQPYTVLESSIYKSLVKVFDEEIAAWKVSKVAPVAPFRDCYATRNMVMSLLGLAVPDISLVFENKNVKWDMYGANSMVKISNDVACLGFLDGGSSTASSVVIGAHQLQDNLLQFDLAASRMAFTSTLLFEEVECSNFKF